MRDEREAPLLARDHRDIDTLFSETVGALARADAAASHFAMDRAWMRLAVHIRAEHKALFPTVLAEHPELASLIQTLRADHDFFMETLARLLGQLRAPDADLAALAVAFAEVDERLQVHNQLEEAEVYPLAGGDPALAARLSAELAFLPERYGN